MRRSFGPDVKADAKADALGRIRFLTGDADTLAGLGDVPAKEPFDEETVAFLDGVSRRVMSLPGARAYPDVVTFGFWIRRAGLMRLKERFMPDAPGVLRLGKGAVFHIGPSNVPVNFAYSLAAGLMMGNANVVRVPSRDFPQVELIVGAFNAALAEHEAMRPRVCLVRYGRDREVNDLLSSLVDVRVVWGGDGTIAELRRSPLAPRAEEVNFADRFSLAVIDSERYMALADRDRVAEDFYNDTFLSDQNACTSPRLVVWTGGRIAEAKEDFWGREHGLARRRYAFQDLQGVDKLAALCRLAAVEPGVRVAPHEDNLVVRVQLPRVTADLPDFMGNSGYFLEYDCGNILELRELCDDKRCQTVAYLGDREALLPLLRAGVRGIDRVVPIGRTMDFDLLWDGYDLAERLARVVRVR